MTFVTTRPEIMATAAGQLTGLGEELNAQNASAMASTSGMTPAAADEVSALIAVQFVSHAMAYQAVTAHAAAVHKLFVSALAASASFYAATETVNASSAI